MTVEDSNKPKVRKYFSVYIDCALTEYSSALAQHIATQSDGKYIAFCNGPIAAIVKCKLLGKECSIDFEQFKSAVLVDIVFEEDDIDFQRTSGSRVDETFFADKECTKAVLDAFKQSGFNVVSINGSYIAPYAAAKSVIDILDQMNDTSS